MDGAAISVYAEAKGEYTTQLCVYLTKPLQIFFLALLETAKTEEPDKKKVLRRFQDLMSQIPDWNVDKVGRETTKIADESGCDYLEELLTAVFIAHTKVLSAIRLGNTKNKSVQITVPKLDHFLHRTLSESARRIWSNVYLFTDDIPSLEKQKNLRQLEVILTECIQQAVRGLLPVKSLLKDYLTEPTPAEDAEAAEEAEAVEVPPVAEPVKETEAVEASPPVVEQVKETVVVEPTTPVVEQVKETVAVVEATTPVEAPPPPVEAPPPPVEAPPQPVEAPQPVAEPVFATQIVVDTEQARVHFSDYNTVFKDGNSEIVPSNNENDEDDDEDTNALKIYDDIQNLSMNDFESLDERPASPLEFEVLN